MVSWRQRGAFAAEVRPHLPLSQGCCWMLQVQSMAQHPLHHQVEWHRPSCDCTCGLFSPDPASSSASTWDCVRHESQYMHTRTCISKQCLRSCRSQQSGEVSIACKISHYMYKSLQQASKHGLGLDTQTSMPDTRHDSLLHLAQTGRSADSVDMGENTLMHSNQLLTPCAVSSTFLCLFMLNGYAGGSTYSAFSCTD